MDNSISKIYRLSKTVLTSKDLSLIWQEKNKDRLKSKISYYAKKGFLIRLTRGVFAKDENYSKYELATSLYTPSYISFETVLREKGVIFQHYDTIFVAGPWPKKLKINNVSINFRKLKPIILFNASGIIDRDNYSVATLERAFLDTLYLFPDYYFDNLNPVNWGKCFKLAGIYQNKQLIKRLEKYAK